MTPSQELRFLILAAQRAGSRMLAVALRPLGLTAAQWEVLVILQAFGPLSLGELGGLLICETGSPSRLVAGLVERGLVLRKESRGDARVLELRLSDAGLSALKSTRKVDATIAGTIDQALSTQEINALVNGLRKLVAGTPTGDALKRRRDKDAG